jgi:hypothetical protein
MARSLSQFNFFFVFGVAAVLDTGKLWTDQHHKVMEYSSPPCNQCVALLFVDLLFSSNNVVACFYLCEQVEPAVYMMQVMHRPSCFAACSTSST